MPYGSKLVLARLARDNSGSGLVEFAMVLPVLLSLYLGTFVISDMISCYRKVTVTTRALADLVGRSVSPSSTPASSTIATYINSAELVLAPYKSANATLEIDELRVCDATHAYVMWSQSQTGSASATPRLSAGSVVGIPANLITTPMVPTSVDGSNVCSNTVAAANTTLVGTAGGYLLLGQTSYAYRPVFSFSQVTQFTVADQIYMIPRLN